METIVVYSPFVSNRLKYVLDWLLKERMQLSYTITNSEADTKSLSFFIAYGKSLPNSLSLPDAGLLRAEKGYQQYNTPTGLCNELPVIFPDSSASYTIPFDLFSALFFLLSRYEEYEKYVPDRHSRYPAVNSLLYKKGWLQRPLADEWVFAFRKEFQAQSGIQVAATHFHFQPTYDIDMAYSHLHKGITRIAGAYARALLKMDIGQISERTQVLKKKQKDPYDSFRWLRQLHKEFDCKPLYFILAAAKTTAYDKNINPSHPAMTRVIKNIVRDGEPGIHPSYYSDEDDRVAKEKKLLEHISGRNIRISRQHYIKVKTPGTYRLLIQNGIANDYSMGYGSHLGFRAGTGNSFLWYDLEKEVTTGLRIHPFCFMDTTAHFELKLPPAEAMERLEAMSKTLEKTGSTLITVFHNFSLGTASEWKGWRNAYEHFVQEKAKLL